MTYRNVSVLWNLYGLLLGVMEELSKGLAQPAEASSNKFSGEVVKKLVEDCCRIIDEIRTRAARGDSGVPPEYLQVVLGIAEVFILRGETVTRTTVSDASQWLKSAVRALRNVANGENHREQIKVVFRFCQVLAGECRMACVEPDPGKAGFVGSVVIDP